MLVADAQHPTRTESLQPLVIAENAAAAIGDVAERSVGSAHHDNGAIDVAELGNVVGDEIGAGGVHLDHLAEKEAGDVEVVDRHVPEQTA